MNYSDVVLTKHTHPHKSTANDLFLIQFTINVLAFPSGEKMEFHFHFRALIQLSAQNSVCIFLETSGKGDSAISNPEYHSLLGHCTASCSKMSLSLLAYIAYTVGQ